MIDLTLDPTIYVQQMACSVMCKLDANDTSASPKQFFGSDLYMTAGGDAGDLGCKEYGEIDRSELPVTP